MLDWHQVKNATPPFSVHTHSVVVRNIGRRPATNVRLGHIILPSEFTVFPSVAYTVTGQEIIFPALVPGEQLTVSYLYPSSILWNQTNTYAKSDQGLARAIQMLPTPQLPRWQAHALRVVLAIGFAAILYGLITGARWLLAHAAQA